MPLGFTKVMIQLVAISAMKLKISCYTSNTSFALVDFGAFKENLLHLRDRLDTVNSSCVEENALFWNSMLQDFLLLLRNVTQIQRSFLECIHLHL